MVAKSIHGFYDTVRNPGLNLSVQNGRSGANLDCACVTLLCKLEIPMVKWTTLLMIIRLLTMKMTQVITVGKSHQLECASYIVYRCMIYSYYIYS